MIERLNFYDLYGYLLPGAVFIAVSFFPFFLTGVPLPSLEWASALGSLMFAYILGHLLQILARTGWNEGPNPSDLLLTSHPRSFPQRFQDQRAKLIDDDFKLDVKDADQLKMAFQACRFACQSKDLPSYAEQFQGLYALLRGLGVASVIGAANYFGPLYGSLREFRTRCMARPCASAQHRRGKSRIAVLARRAERAKRNWQPATGSGTCLRVHGISRAEPVAGWVVRGWAQTDPEVAILACALVGPLVWAARVISPFSLACTVALVAGAVSAEPLRPSDQLFLLLASAAALLTLSVLFFVAHRHFRWPFAEAVYTTYYARRKSPLTNGALKT